MKLKKTIMVAATLITAACTQNAHYHIAQANFDQVTQINNFYLEIDDLENAPLLVETYPEPWRYQQVSSSIMAAQYSTPPPAPGVSPGQAAAAGAAASLFGAMIANNMAKSQAQDAAQTPAAPLIQTLTERTLVRDVREFLVDKILTSEFADSHNLKYEPGTDKAYGKLKLRPAISLTNNLDVFKINLNVEVLSAKKQPLYRNSIEYWSAGTGLSDPLANLEYWQNAELSAFYEELEQGVLHLSVFLSQSLKGSLFREDLPIATHKIASTSGWVLIRGRVLQASDELVVVRDLRGNIKLIRGSLLVDS